MKKCDKCGHILYDYQLFCNMCGLKWIDKENINNLEIKKENTIKSLISNLLPFKKSN